MPRFSSLVLSDVLMQLYSTMVLDGLSYASYLFIVSVGLTIIFGVMKILNVAHGALYTWGAYGAAWSIKLLNDNAYPDWLGFIAILGAAINTCRYGHLFCKAV